MSFFSKKGAVQSVIENIEEFREMYYPIISEQYKNLIKQEKGYLSFPEDPQGRKELFKNLADNIFHNMKGKLSPRLYDHSIKYSRNYIFRKGRTRF